MLVRPVEYDLQKLLDYHRELAKSRSAGLHLSDVLKSLCRKLDAKRFSGERTPETHLLFEVGFMFERAFSKAIAPGLLYGTETPKLIVQPETLLDGVFMTGDWFNLDAWRYEETKFSDLSSDHDWSSPQLVHFWWQVMANCLSLDTNRGLLVILHNRGNYKEFRRKQLNIWEAEFTPGELRENWNMILEEADTEFPGQRGA